MTTFSLVRWELVLFLFCAPAALVWESGCSAPLKRAAAIRLSVMQFRLGSWDLTIGAAGSAT